MLRSRLLGGVFGAALLLGIGSAQAAPTTALYLSMDGSGSIDAGEFTQQVNSYVNALNAFFGANPGAFGTVAIGGNIFGGTVAQFFPLTSIDDAADLAALTGAIAGLNPGRGGIATGSTAIGAAVNAATAALTAFATANASINKLLIDVTTDGANNQPPDPVTAVNNAIAAGVDAVNCLSIGLGGDCSFIGANGTNFGADNFANLELALTQKIQFEVFGVPEPMSMAIFGLGLAGLGVVARRRAA